MSRRGHARLGIALAVLLAALAVVWWFPAAWAWPWLAPRYPGVQALGVSGSVWNGSARDVSMAGTDLGRVQWRLSRRLMIGHLAGQIAVRGHDLALSGHFTRARDGAIVARGWHFRVALERWPDFTLHGLHVRGVLSGHIKTMRWLHGWPVSLDATLDWRHAVLTSGQGGGVTLGHLTSNWHGAAGVVQGVVRNVGGPVGVDGKVVLTTLGWRIDGVLRSGTQQAGLRSLLGRFGQWRADGSLHIQARGGLALGDGQP